MNPVYVTATVRVMLYKIVERIVGVRTRVTGAYRMSSYNIFHGGNLLSATASVAKFWSAIGHELTHAIYWTQMSVTGDLLF